MLTINGKAVAVAEGTTILEAARSSRHRNPKPVLFKRCPSVRLLPHLRGGGGGHEEPSGLLHGQGARGHGGSHQQRRRCAPASKVLYELMLSNHSKDCLSCERNQNCELQALGERLGVTRVPAGGRAAPRMWTCSPVHHPRYLQVHPVPPLRHRVQRRSSTWAPSHAQNRGFDTVISPAMGLPLNSTACAMCGQCTVVCPTGALQETDGLKPRSGRRWQTRKSAWWFRPRPLCARRWARHSAIQCGTSVTGKMASALHELGFDDVFDTNFAADLTILEEGTELLHRLEAALTGRGGGAAHDYLLLAGLDQAHRARLPGRACPPVHLQVARTPCWARWSRATTPKSSAWTRRTSIVVSVMPCTAKKYEIQRPGACQPGRRAGRGRGADHARAGPDDQVAPASTCARCRRGRSTRRWACPRARRTSSA